jgi:predicted site-specific integrase-resolvase
MTKIHKPVNQPHADNAVTDSPISPAVLTIPQAANALQVSVKTIYNALNAGKIFSVYVLGARRIPADEIVRIASLGTIANESEISAHYARCNPENSVWARNEMARRLAARGGNQSWI